MTCPICAKEADPKYRPFCSRRCADVDLGKWLTGGYVLPSNDADTDRGEGDLDDEGAAPAIPLRPV